MKAGEDYSEKDIPGLPSLQKVIFNLSAPFIFAGICFFVISLLIPFDSFEKLMGLMVLNLIPPAGKESIIPLGIALGIPWWIIATSTTVMDIAGAMFMALNFDLALKIPLLGRWIKGIMEGGESFFESHRWMEKLSEIGLVFFVIIPFQGSGGIGGTIVGRMMGIPKLKVILAISAGAFIGSFSIALGIEYFLEIFKFDPVVAAVVLSGIMLAVAVTYILKDRYDKKLRSGFKKKMKLLKK